jgi:hypothetical protein
VTDAKPPEPSKHPVDVGLRSEAAILSELVRRGYSVLLPFGVNQRYDHGIYAVPVEHAPIRQMSLRVSPSENGQAAGVNLAKDYELPA